MRHFIFINPYKSLCSFFEGETTGAGGGGGDITKNTPLPTAKEVIADAIKTVAEGEAKKEEPVVKDETKVEETKKEEVKEPEFTKEQQEAALNIYKGLAHSDPKIQLATLELLAKAAGKDLKDVETKKEAVEVKKDITALLKEGLGEFDFLADKLAPVLDKVIKEAIADNTKDIRDKQVQTDREKAEAAVNATIDGIFNSYTLSEADRSTLVAEMEVVMDSVRPGPKSTQEQYFKSIIQLAAQNKSITLKTAASTKTLAEKIVKNRNDAPSRLASERGAEVKDVVRTTEFKNLKEAIADAVKQTAAARQ